MFILINIKISFYEPSTTLKMYRSVTKVTEIWLKIEFQSFSISCIFNMLPKGITGMKVFQGGVWKKIKFSCTLRITQRLFECILQHPYFSQNIYFKSISFSRCFSSTWEITGMWNYFHYKVNNITNLKMDSECLCNINFWISGIPLVSFVPLNVMWMFFK